MMNDDVVRLLLDWTRSRFFGKYRGKVTDNQDATSKGRLKVMVPAVCGELEVWAMPCVPYAGKGVGFMSLPAPDAGVWVEFEGGDPSFPIWVGCFWADGEAPESGKPDIKIWQTAGAAVRIDDGGPELKLKTDDQTTITLTDEVATEAGQAKHSVGSSGVTSESGASKLEVAPASVSVNDGALEVA
jgi:uncharacterized protein involved in type VI secretion and phage assembly